jgi:hypothetical protein
LASSDTLPTGPFLQVAFHELCARIVIIGGRGHDWPRLPRRLVVPTGTHALEEGMAFPVVHVTYADAEAFARADANASWAPAE